MKDRQFHIYLDDEEYGQVLQALIDLKNNLIAQGRYTDAVDDVLIKFTKAPAGRRGFEKIDTIEQNKNFVQSSGG